MYRVPNTDENKSLGAFESILEKVSNGNKNIIIGTDQNFDYMKLDNHNNTSILLETFLQNRLTPCITKATRVTYSTATLIDNLYLNVKCSPECLPGILISELSDHFPIVVCR